MDIGRASFASFALLPIMALLVAPAFGGHLGGATLVLASLRVTVGGALAMAVTAAIGRTLHVAG